MDAYGYGRLVIIATMVFLGFNIHQITQSFSTLNKRVKDAREFFAKEAPRGWGALNFVFYVFLPSIYLYLAFKAEFAPLVLWGLLLKLAMSSTLGFFIQRQALFGKGYTKPHHVMGKVDNALNLATCSLIALLLIFPLHL